MVMEIVHMKQIQKRIAIIQPMVPHYRQEFYTRLQDEYDVDIYSWQDIQAAKNNGFDSAKLEYHKLKGISLGSAIIYNCLPFLFGRYNLIVLVQEMKYVSHWFILLLARLFGKKVILWGHGITAAKYTQFESKMPLSRKIMYRLADGAWFYTKKEQELWQEIMPELKSVALGNTVGGVSDILKIDLDKNNRRLKDKYNVKTVINFVICTRFTDLPRRMDLFVGLVERLDPNKYGFIVIGEGPQKPNFSRHSNVYDFGAVYDKATKDELFTLADIYFQPGWCGLSIVEAMAYGKPIFTFERSKDVLQCVEYGYIKHGFNGMIFHCLDELCNYIEGMEIGLIEKMGQNAREYVQENLTMENMIRNAVTEIEQIV